MSTCTASQPASPFIDQNDVDHLEEARSKAYGYASRYVAKLNALNLSIDGYADFPDHVAYMSRLRERHGRKHAFWRRLKGVE